MCGRYASIKTAAEIAEEFGAQDATGGEPAAAGQTGPDCSGPADNSPADRGPADRGPGYTGPDYNVAPTKPVLAVVQRHPRDADGIPDRTRTERSVRTLRWGLVPSWAKDPSVGARMINARAESAAEKPAFRKALAARRALMPAAGWYEWRQGAGKGPKQPYFVTGTDGASLAMAALWEFWRPADGGDPLITCAVLTTDAVGPLAEIHHRMPLLLSAEHWAAWLDPDSGAPPELLRPPSAELVAGLELRPVSTRVNNVRNQGPELMVEGRMDDAEEPALDLDLPAQTPR